jgi:pimeloyl-ACP methyl ester carboxylesterase
MIDGARALLLGWSNAAPSQLLAYERLHKTFGLEPSSVIPNTLAALGRADTYHRALAPMAADLAAEGGARPIVVHVFSDNGFLGWAALLDTLDTSEGGRRAKAAMRGVIFDSSPGLWAVRGPVDLARRFALGITPAISRLAKRGPQERLRVVTPLLALGFLGYQVAFRKCVRAMLSAGRRVSEGQPRCPQLFLYGEHDILVPPRDIRAWIARQRDVGIDVEDHAFQTARHVALYPNDPRRYRSSIKAFMERVLWR